MRHVKRLHATTNGFKKTLIAWTLILTLGTGYALWSIQAVQDRALERMRDDVTRCFLAPGRLKPAKVAECAAEFDDSQTPGNDYRQVQESSVRNLKVFADLQRRVARLEQAQKGRR